MSLTRKSSCDEALGESWQEHTMGTSSIETVTITKDLAVDLTRDTEYERLVNEEIDHYSAIEVKEDLTEGGAHGHKAWDYNYKYLCERIFQTSFWDEVADHANR